MILAIQDTTDLSFSHHSNKRKEKGFGPISAHKYSLGLKVHSALAVTSQGVPLGLLDQITWAREPKQKGKSQQKRSLFEKESKRWFSSLVATELSIPDETVVVTIADREADIFDLFALERRAHSHLLIRADHEVALRDRIERALATYSIVAWRLLWLTIDARVNPESPCDRVLETEEWQALYARIHKSKKIPNRPPCLRQAVRWIAQLGGFLARKSDKEPGVKTIWRGLRRLNDLVTGWKLKLSTNYE